MSQHEVALAMQQLGGWVSVAEVDEYVARNFPRHSLASSLESLQRMRKWGLVERRVYRRKGRLQIRWRLVSPQRSQDARRAPRASEVARASRRAASAAMPGELEVLPRRTPERGA